jgi:hypothetical protein
VFLSSISLKKISQLRTLSTTKTKKISIFKTDRFTALVRAFSFIDDFQQSDRDKDAIRFAYRPCLATDGNFGLEGF